MEATNEDYPSLGKIHQNYNKLVQDAIKNKKHYAEKTFTTEKCDTDNLMKIDIACHNKDVDYILSVFKSEDMLYVSRALKQSVWLVDDQYEHIINPEYLNNELLPEMTAKAGIKLLKHIRQHLKTEKRVEDFYNNETILEKKGKWLSRCSVPFIVEHINDHGNTLSKFEYKRLYERSFIIFEKSVEKYVSRDKFEAASFFLHTHMDKYLDLFEATNSRYSRPDFSPNATELIMKQTPDRIKNNFLMYVNYIHVPTFVRYIEKSEIKDFLYKLANRDDKDMENSCQRIFNFKILKYFVKGMLKAEQFEFVKKVFLDKNVIQIKEPLERGSEMFIIKRICDMVCSATPSYKWYEFAPFDIALMEMKKLLHAETVIEQKYSMLHVLLKSAGNNTKDLLALLIYYTKNHQNDDNWRKIGFVKELILQTDVFKNDDETCNSMMEIFSNMVINTVDDYDHQYTEIMVLYNALHNKEVSEIIEKNFLFNTFIKYRSKLNQEEQNKLFEYLYEYINKKIDGSKHETEQQFCEIVQLHNKLLDLINDWDKKITDYPAILNKIKDLIKIRQKNDWKTNLSSFYKKNKSWKRPMFEDSLVLNPCQEVCVNALKHDPGLLSRYNSEVETLCCDDTKSLIQMLRKLRIYWPQSLADTFTKSYLDRLNKLGGHKALTRGLFTLLPKEPTRDFINKYAPTKAKIDWDNTDELTLSLQRSIAKNMHIGRPQPSADAIILYAKGDFLQYALPSLLAIYYNMSRSQSQELIPKLLNAPVSLQKHGLRFAFDKLKHEELKSHLANVWKTTKNITIRAVTFVLLFDLMCKEKDDSKALELWEILEFFMDNISFEEDKKIYEKLSEVEKVPLVIRPKFLVKSYNFLKKLLPHVKSEREQYEYSIQRLAVYTREVMEFICPDFVSGLITEFLDQKFCNNELTHLDHNMILVVTSYLLCAKKEETQIKRYEQILAPLIKRCLDQWNITHNERYYIRDHFESLLTKLSQDLHEYVIKNKMIIPTKMFNNIKKELDTYLNIQENYIMLTMWKLIVKLTELISENDTREDWNEVCSLIAPKYGKYCLDVLKEDVKLYFSCIYILYARVLNMSIRDILPDTVSLQIFEQMLSDTDFTQGFLVTVKIFADRPYWSDELKDKKREILKSIRDHASVEVKMHYYCAFKHDNDDEE